ncbi:MAG: hypothetical protein AB1898_13795 [Acidobacteriota bacterium]
MRLAAYLLTGIIVLGLLHFSNRFGLTDKPKAPVRATEMSGESVSNQVFSGHVKTVAPKKRRLWVSRPPIQMIFSWDERTRMVVAKHAVNPSALRPGAQVEVHFRKTQQQNVATEILITPTSDYSRKP